MIAVIAGLRSWVASNPRIAGMLLVGGALAAVSLAAFVWAAFFRPSGGRRPSHRHHWREGKSSGDSRRHERSGFSLFKRRRRRKRKRSTNPTLAETGGLPPPRHSASEPSPEL